MKKIRELCFAGAANRGICYIGVLEYLTKYKLIKLEKFSGVSIGSLIGVGYIIGYTPKELLKSILSKNTSEFEDISLNNFLNCGSILKGDNYKVWIWEILSNKIDPLISFKDFYNKFNIELYITAVCLDESENSLEEFSHINTPELSIFHAIMASMAIPFVFPPVYCGNKRYIDGGLLNNFPMESLSEEAIGFRISSKKAILPNDNYDIKLIVTKIIQLISSHMKKLQKFKGTEIIINAKDFDTINFNLNIDDKLTLYYRGYFTSLNYFEPLIINNELELMSLEDHNIIIKEEEIKEEKLDIK